MSAVAELPAVGLTGLSDGRLMRAHRSGRDEAFEVLYRRYHRRLVAFCGARLQDTSLAEDLAHETIVRALKYGDSFDASRPIWPWLRTIAVRTIIDHGNRRSTDEIVVDFDTERTDDVLVDEHDCTDEIELRQVMEEALAGLQPRHQVALQLRYLEDWSREDVAGFLGLTRNAADQLLHRASRKLRAEYERLSESSSRAFALLAVPVRGVADRLRLWVDGLTRLAVAVPSADAVVNVVVATTIAGAAAAGGTVVWAVEHDAGEIATVVAAATDEAADVLRLEQVAEAVTRAPAPEVEVPTAPAPRTIASASQTTATGDSVALDAAETSTNDDFSATVDRSVRVGDEETGGVTGVEVPCTGTVGDATCDAYESLPPPPTD